MAHEPATSFGAQSQKIIECELTSGFESALCAMWWEEVPGGTGGGCWCVDLYGISQDFEGKNKILLTAPPRMCFQGWYVAEERRSGLNALKKMMMGGTVDLCVISPTRAFQYTPWQVGFPFSDPPNSNPLLVPPLSSLHNAWRGAELDIFCQSQPKVASKRIIHGIKKSTHI